MKESIVIINNEKCMEVNKHFYCENIEMKSMPESLSRFFDINLILRKGIINPAHKIEVIKTSLSSNIISFIFIFYRISRSIVLTKSIWCIA